MSSTLGTSPACATDPRVLAWSSIDDVAFDVSWFAVHSFGLDKAPALLSSLDRKGIANTAQRAWKSSLSLERVSMLEFLLQVHGSEDQDFGNYYCSVTPWVKSPTGSWQKEAEIQSKPIFITVKMDGKNDTQITFPVFGECLLRGFCHHWWDPASHPLRNVPAFSLAWLGRVPTKSALIPRCFPSLGTGCAGGTIGK